MATVDVPCPGYLESVLDGDETEATMVHRVEHAEIIEMLRARTKECGLDLGRFHELGRSGELDNPELRDLWLIWGDVITEADLEATISG